MREGAPIRDRLMAVARRYAGRLRYRPGVAGVVLYGSLARGGVTEFSDVDLVSVCEGEAPACSIEHRLVDGAKVDVVAVQRAALDAVAAGGRLRPAAAREVPLFVLESLLLGGPEAILVDPHGVLRGVREALCRATTYAEVAASFAPDYLEDASATMAEACERLRQGELAQAMGQVRWCEWALAGTVQLLAANKDVAAAAGVLGLPGFARALASLQEIRSPQRPAAEAVLLAADGLWQHSLGVAYETLLERLRQARAGDPEALELVGNYGLFWPGCRVHEPGRVIAEVDLSLRWSRHVLDAGRVAEALDTLWACRDAEATSRRWTAIGAACAGAGYDVSEAIQPLLDDPELARLEDSLKAANAEADSLAASAHRVEEALRLLEEMRVLLQQVVPGG